MIDLRLPTVNSILAVTSATHTFIFPSAKVGIELKLMYGHLIKLRLFYDFYMTQLQKGFQITHCLLICRVTDVTPDEIQFFYSF